MCSGKEKKRAHHLIGYNVLQVKIKIIASITFPCDKKGHDTRYD